MKISNILTSQHAFTMFSHRLATSYKRYSDVLAPPTSSDVHKLPAGIQSMVRY